VPSAASSASRSGHVFVEYVIREHHPSFRSGDEVRVGAVLSERGVTLYVVSREYPVGPGYRYAIVRGQ